MHIIRIVQKSVLLAAVAAAMCVIGASSALTAEAQTVPTRLGDLTLENGYPSRETADRLYDEIDFQRATQAYL